MVSKKDEVLKNGRNSKSRSKFENWFCRIYPEHVTYPAWKALSKTATDVVHICRAKSEHAAYNDSKNKVKKGGRPIFEFTATEAEKIFVIPRPTFSDAMASLIEKGFLTVVRRGGLPDGKGVSSQYQLSDEWKTWTPPPRDNTNIIKAQLARIESLAAKKRARASSDLDSMESIDTSNPSDTLYAYP